MSEEASDQLIEMFELTTANFERAVKSMHKKDRALAEETILVEKILIKQSADYVKTIFAA